VQEGDIGKQEKIKIATLTAQLKETEATISSKGLSDETVNQRQSLQAQLKAWQDVQEALKTAKSAVVVRPPIYRAPAGNRRGYLNSPVGIAPPQ
jgi:LPS O-antigen subunit length determinant protein (WzzB/FepE family)